MVEPGHVHRIGCPEQGPVQIEDGQDLGVGRQGPQSWQEPTPNYHRLPVTLLDVHEAWAWFVVIGNGLAGLWALAAHRWEALRSRALWWFVGVVEVSIFVQVGLGVALVSIDDLQPPSF